MVLVVSLTLTYGIIDRDVSEEYERGVLIRGKDKARMKRWVTILAVAILELLAVIGALPLLYGGWGRPEQGFWEANSMALPAFLMLVAGGTVFYLRYESRTVRVVAPIIMVGALMLTITAVQVLA